MSATGEQVSEGIVLRKRRGLRKGMKHSGSFQKNGTVNGGNDPRISRDKTSRYPVIAEAQRLAAEHLAESTELLVLVMRDDTQPVRTRVDCALHLQARAAGNPVSISVLADMSADEGLNGNGKKNGHDIQAKAASNAPPAAYTKAQLEKFISNQIDQEAQRLNDEPIEAEFSEVTDHD